MADHGVSERIALAALLALAVLGLGAVMFGLAPGRPLLPTADATLAVLPDNNASLTWHEVRALPDRVWQPWTTNRYIQSIHGGAVWVRVTLRNPTPQPQAGVLADAEYYTDHVELWMPDDTANGWSHRISGECIPGPAKPIWGRDTAFFVSVPARSTRTVILRAEDYFGVWLNLRWWPEARDFFAMQLRTGLAEALYFGILAALLIYNGVLWSRLRHRDLGHYLAYLASIAIFMFFGRAQFPQFGLPMGSTRLEPLAAASAAASCFFLVRFGREFLGLRAIAPRLDRVAQVLGLLNFVLVPGALTLVWGNNTQWMHYVGYASIATHGIMILAGLTAWRAGVQHARFYLLAFGALLLGIVPFAVFWLAAIPLGPTQQLLMMGSGLEMLLLSLMLSDRFALLERDRHAALLAGEQARLELLRYQLNPHFLFNALNSIYGFVLPHSRPAGELVRRLADFCRLTLTRRHDARHPLAEEFALLRNYLDIEQLRWGDRFSLNVTLAADTADFPLPPFLLLPLVENAVKHGGATSPDRLDLRLTARRETDGTVVLAVANTGRWLEAGEPRSTPSTGIGLENFRARLRNAFPLHTLDFASRDGWVTVTLRLTPSPSHD
ncbi:MAG: ATP-binding protein [Rariglobus sp.]|jgi:hypothetical protein|nr:ATP-binding protein [Rariglobus sp.]